MPRSPQQTTSAPRDLTAQRERQEAAIAACAQAAVRHLPTSLLESLQGAWGTPEALGLSPLPEPYLRLVAG